MPEGKTHFIADLVDADTAIEEAKRVAERVAVECKLSDESLKEAIATTKGLEPSDPMLTPGASSKYDGGVKKAGGCLVM